MKYSQLVQTPQQLLVSRFQACAILHSRPLMDRLVYFGWVRRIEAEGIIELFRLSDIERAIERLRKEELPQLPKRRRNTGPRRPRDIHK